MQRYYWIFLFTIYSYVVVRDNNPMQIYYLFALTFKLSIFVKINNIKKVLYCDKMFRNFKNVCNHNIYFLSQSS